MADELTRKQLQEQLEAVQAENARLKQGNPAQDAVTAKQLAEAQAELAALHRARPTAPLTGVAPKLVRYEGFAQATEDCHIGGQFRNGPKDGAPGDVFRIDVPALWSDDPYRAVTVRISDETNQPIVTPNPDAPTPIDFRFRFQGQGDTQIQPLRANQF